MRLLHIIYVFVCFLKITWIFKNPVNQQIDDQKEHPKNLINFPLPPKNTTTPTPTNLLPCYASPLAVASRFDAKLADLTGRPWPNISCPKALGCTAVLPVESTMSQRQSPNSVILWFLKSHEWFESIWVLWDPEIEKMLRFEICVGSGCANFTTTKPRTVSNPCPAAPNDGNHKPALNDHQNKCKRTARPSGKSESVSVVSCRAQVELKKLTVVAWNDGPSRQRIASPDWSLPTKLCCYDPPPCVCQPKGVPDKYRENCLS